MTHTSHHIRGCSLIVAGGLIVASALLGQSSGARAEIKANEPAPFVRLGHAAGIVSAAWQPDGKLIVTAGLDNSALLWDSETGRPTAVLGGHRAAVQKVAWSSDGKLLATAAARGGATVWDAAGATAVEVVGELDSAITAIDWRPGGTSLALGFGGKVPGVELWDAASRQRRRLGVTPHQVTSLEWSADGRYLAGGLSGGEVLLWETDQADPGPRVVMSLADSVTQICWQPASSRLAAASDRESRVAICDAAGKQPSLALDGHRAGILGLAWSPDGTRLASASEDRNVVLWDPAGRALQRLTDHVGPVRALAWTPNGRQIATGSDDRSIIIWEAESGTAKAALTGLGQPVTSISWNPAGTRLVGASILQNYGLIWDPGTQEIRLRLAGSVSLRQRLSWLGPRRLLATSPESGIALWDLDAAVRRAPPDGARSGGAAAGHSSGRVAFNTTSRPTGIAIWSPSDLPTRPALSVRTPAAAGVAEWSRDGSALAVGDDQGGVSLFNLPPTKATTLSTHRQPVSAIAWSPDGKMLVSGSVDGSLALFTRSPWRKVVSLLGSVPVEHLAFSADGTRLAVQGSGGRGDVWDLPNRKLLRAFTGRLATWSPNGKVLALDRGVWNPGTGAFIAGLSREPEALTALAWRPNGASLAVSAADGSIVLREPATGGALATLAPAGRPVVSLAWSPDGKFLSAATSDGVIHLWRIEGNREIASLYTFEGGANWLILTPAGPFSASPRGADRLQWRVGETLFPIDRYRARFENRKAVAAALN